MGRQDLLTGRHNLIIENCKKSDEAIYGCVAGTEVTSARLYVEKVEIIKKLQAIRVVQSKEFELSAETSKSSITGQWLKDGREVRSSENVQMNQRGAYHSLKIKNAQPEDTGEYTFKVGCKSTSAKVTVDAVCVTKAITDKKIKETRRAVLECELSVADGGMCRWIKDGKEIIPSSNVIVSKVDKVRRLEIRHCSDNDAGEYKCDVLNGVDGCVANLCVSPVRFITELPQSVRADQSTREIDITCVLDSEDIETYWKKDGKRIATTGGRYTSFVKGKTPVLRINEPRRVHSGLYSAVAGSKFTSCNLLIETENVDIMKSQKNIEVIVNHQASLDFTVSKPDLQAKWYKNGQLLDITNDERFKYVVDGTRHSLKFSKTKFDDAGEYEIEIGDTRSTTYIYVQAPEEPRFVQELRDCIVECGETAHFTVRASGRPAPTLTWYKNKEEITAGLKYLLKKDEDQHTLVLLEAVQSDSATYTCTATNESGVFQTTASLHVNVKEEEVVVEKERNISSEQSLQIIEPLQDFITREGQSARFTCKITGTNAQVKWRRNKLDINTNTDFFKTSVMNGIYQLDITEVNAGDEGTYDIVASNTLGETSSSAKLKLDISAPKVIEPLKPLHVIEGSLVRLSCVIEGEQLVIRWFKNGEEVTNHARYQCGRYENGVCWLIMESSRPEDSAEIRCHASNVSGEAICSTDLLITEKETLDDEVKRYVSEIERFQGAATPYEIRVPALGLEVEFSPAVIEPLSCNTNGHETHLRVRLAAFPAPEIYWFKDGELIGPDEYSFQQPHYRFSYESDAQYYMSTLIISQTNKEESSGRYECKAWNKLGQVCCSTELNLKAAAGKGSREMENPDEQRYNSLESSKTPGGNHKSYRVNMRFANVNRSGTVCSMKERLSNYFDEPSSRDISTYTMNLDGSSRMSTPLFNVTVGHTPSPGLLNMRKFQDTT